jgi:hypothetical protein
MRLSWLEGLSWQNQMSTSRFVDLMQFKEQTKCKHLFYTSPHFPTKKGLDCKQRACHTLALPFTLKSILMQKKNHARSWGAADCLRVRQLNAGFAADTSNS